MLHPCIEYVKNILKSTSNPQVEFKCEISPTTNINIFPCDRPCLCRFNFASSFGKTHPSSGDLEESWIFDRNHPFSHGRFQMFRKVDLEVRPVFVRKFLRYINQCTTCRRFCGCLFNVVRRNMYIAGWKVRLCDSTFCYAYYVKV